VISESQANKVITSYQCWRPKLDLQRRCGPNMRSYSVISSD
jgi:hypothetical protein